MGVLGVGWLGVGWAGARLVGCGRIGLCGPYCRPLRVRLGEWLRVACGCVGVGG
jgi:hypothetical protein